MHLPSYFTVWTQRYEIVLKMHNKKRKMPKFSKHQQIFYWDRGIFFPPTAKSRLISFTFLFSNLCGDRRIYLQQLTAFNASFYRLFRQKLIIWKLMENFGFFHYFISFTLLVAPNKILIMITMDYAKKLTHECHVAKWNLGLELLIFENFVDSLQKSRIVSKCFSNLTMRLTQMNESFVLL